MEDPVAEIPTVIQLLTQSPPSLQQAALERYFTRSASFTHPFCRTGSYDWGARLPESSTLGWLLRERGPLPAVSSRALTAAIYRWYKVLSPRIELHVDSVALDPTALVLYVGLRQTFRVPYVPFYSAPVQLVTVLQLEREGSRYRIASQNDRYQVDEWVKFVSVFRLLWGVLVLLQFGAALVCLFAQAVASPVVWAEEQWAAKSAHQKALKIEAEEDEGGDGGVGKGAHQKSLKREREAEEDGAVKIE